MVRPRRRTPKGTLTFLFTDIEGSTLVLEKVGQESYRDLLEEHQRLLRAAFAVHHGTERSTEGDSFFVVFSEAPSAIAAAADGQRALAAMRSGPADLIRVRMGLHTGLGRAGGDDYVGLDVHRAARIAAAAHGGQVLISDATRILTEDALPDDLGLVYLGEYILRGISSPERLYQLAIAGLPSDFPPPRTEPVAKAHVPPRLTSFVGRDEDLDMLKALVADNRLVTLVGTGGTGKTALATECARGLAANFDDGAWFVALDAISEAELVPAAIVGALGLRDSTRLPAKDQLVENLSQRALLLVLDNFEHVLTASSLVGTILAAAPAIRVIATSRAPLHIAAEQVYPVAPLPLPDPTQRADQSTAPDEAALVRLAAVPAIRLFVDRVRRVQPGFSLTLDNAAAVVDICTHLDGLPLGIELAAARVPLLGVGAIADRLMRHMSLPSTPVRDVPARQRTLHETIAWSYGLLDPRQQVLFAYLSVFNGGWRLEEAQSVCELALEPGAGTDFVDDLAALVDQSLVIAKDVDGRTRFEMLETIREYAAAELVARDDAPAIARRHAVSYLALAEAITPAIRKRGRAAALGQLRVEQANLRAAVRWAIANQEAEIALRLGTALVELRGAPPWGLGSGIDEARATIVAVLDVPGAEVPSVARMRALEAAGTAFYYVGDNTRASTFYAGQLEVAEQLGDLQGAADARFNVLWTQDAAERAAHIDEQLERVGADYRAIGDQRGLARLAFLRGQRALEVGRREEGVATFEAAMRKYTEHEDLSYASMTAGSLGLAYLELGDRDAAIHWWIDGVIRLAQDLGDEVAMTVSMRIGAIAAIERDRPEAAVMITGAHESLSRAFGVRGPIVLDRVFEAYGAMERARSVLDPITFEAALARGRQMSLGEATDLVLEMDAPQQPTTRH